LTFTNANDARRPSRVAANIPPAVITASIIALLPFINSDFEAPKVSETLLRPLARTAR
jgi:hypothetical protein